MRHYDILKMIVIYGILFILLTNLGISCWFVYWSTSWILKMAGAILITVDTIVLLGLVKVLEE